jgi:hypothetical protein
VLTCAYPHGFARMADSSTVESTMDVDEDDLPALVARAATVFGDRLDGLFDLVEAVHHRVADVFDGFAERHRSPDRSALASARPLVRQLLATDQPLLEGFDMAVGPETLTDAGRWIECWRRDGAGDSYFVKHVLNPDAVGFYDYQSHDWFTAPLAAGHAVAIGPYIDSGGIDACTITLGMPLAVATGGTAVIGADLSIAGLEALLLRTLRTRRHQVVVLAANGRVIVSNSAHHVTGSLLRLADSERIEHSVDIPSRDPRRLRWRIVGVSA